MFRTAFTRRLAATLALAAGLCAAAGCGPSAPKLYKVKGKVTFADGKPLSGGNIMFMSVADEARKSAGDIQPDGTFELFSNATGDAGAVEGEHKVMIIPERPEWGGDAKSQPLGKYQSFDTSGLTFTVKPTDDNFCDIKLERPKK